MGLAGRKEKQRIPNDPRNLSWADDAARFGQSYMSKLGWDPSKGLGASGDGMKSHLKVSQKLDMLGIGAAHQKDPHGIAWKQNKEFEALLQRLNAQGGQDSTSTHVLGEFVRPEHPAADAHPEKDKEPNQSSKKEKKRKRKGGEYGEDEKDKKKRKKDKRQDEDVEDSAVTNSSKPASLHIDPPASSSILQTRPKGRPMAHRARIQAAKRLANKSAAAISEILGIAPTPSSVSSTTPSGSLTPITPTESDLPLDKLTTSTKSVADYFKEKLGAKSGSNTPATNDDDSTSRGGIGSSASSRDDVNQPRIGLGAGRSFGEVGSSNVFAQFFNTSSSSHATVVQMASSATHAIIQPPEPTTSSSTENSRDEEMTEKQRRKAQRKEERKRRDAEVVDVPAGAGVEVPDNNAKVDKKKGKEERKAKGAEPPDLVPSVVLEESEEGLES
jgi:Pin2-interacting protein X1